jgi:hypothetical protein
MYRYGRRTRTCATGTNWTAPTTPRVSHCSSCTYRCRRRNTVQIVQQRDGACYRVTFLSRGPSPSQGRVDEICVREGRLCVGPGGDLTADPARMHAAGRGMRQHGTGSVRVESFINDHDIILKFSSLELIAVARVHGLSRRSERRRPSAGVRTEVRLDRTRIENAAQCEHRCGRWAGR